MKKFINDTDNKMKEVDVDIKYDIAKTKDTSNFVNDTNQWKSVFVPDVEEK